MGPISPIRRRRTASADRKKVGKSQASAASVSKSVLNFLAYGLTEGAESLAENWTPSSKVDEFVLVSGEILGALKREYQTKFKNDRVVMFMKVNNQQKQVELSQLGRDVMMTLDDSELYISNMTLTQLYAKIRNDMIRHADIYGKDLQLTAVAAPAP